MSLNDIIAEVATVPSTNRGDEPPADDRAPDASAMPETSMRTGAMLPPYLHNQSETVISMLLTVGSLYSLAKLIGRYA